MTGKERKQLEKIANGYGWDRLNLDICHPDDECEVCGSTNKQSLWEDIPYIPNRDRWNHVRMVLCSMHLLLRYQNYTRT
jgi:hypothetical protein